MIGGLLGNRGVRRALGSLGCGCKGLVRGGAMRMLVSDVRAWEKESKGLGDAGETPERA